EILSEYEQHPGVLANWAVFGSSGHLTRPPSLVIESYTHRMKAEEGPQQSKTILDPSRAERCGGAHFFLYKEGVGSAAAALPRPRLGGGRRLGGRRRSEHDRRRCRSPRSRRLGRRLRRGRRPSDRSRAWSRRRNGPVLAVAAMMACRGAVRCRLRLERG